MSICFFFSQVGWFIIFAVSNLSLLFSQVSRYWCQIPKFSNKDLNEWWHLLCTRYAHFFMIQLLLQGDGRGAELNLCMIKKKKNSVDHMILRGRAVFQMIFLIWGYFLEKTSFKLHCLWLAFFVGRGEVNPSRLFGSRCSQCRTPGILTWGLWSLQSWKGNL